jgi:hypothetical protein
MAVDTRQKRFSIMSMGSASISFIPVFEADGSVDADDRQHLLNRYSGIAFAGLGSAAAYYYQRRRRAMSMQLFQQSEATVARRLFPLYLVDQTDGLTPETGESGGQPQISKNGGAWANTTATLTAVGNGYYTVSLSASELDTVGIISVRYDSANTAEFNMDAQVVPWDPYDSVRMGLTALPNAAAEAAGGLYTRGTGAGQINQHDDGFINVNLIAVNGQTQTAGDIFDSLGATSAIAGTGDPDNSTGVVAYLKQLINIMIGSSGINPFPAEAAPGNFVSLAEVIHAIHEDVTGLAGAAMRGTDSAALASVCTEARLSELDAGTAGKAANQIDIIQVDTTTDIPASISALNDLSAADVNAQVVDVIRTDTSTLPAQGAPPATPTLEEMILYLYKAFRNKKEQTATEWRIYDDAGTTVDHKSTVSDDGTTATKGEVLTGP